MEITAALFPRTTASEMRSSSHAASLFSPVWAVILLPSCRRNVRTLVPKTPVVSTATGWKMYRSVSAWYLPHFRSSALRAADPGSTALPTRDVAQKVSTHVASQVRHFPLLYGKTVTPSGRLPSPLSNPTGSSHEGIPAVARARFTTSLR